MRVCEGQRRGTLMVLIAAVAVYGGALICQQRFLAESIPPWINQNPGMLAVEIAGDRGSEGIYFLPSGTSFTKILKFTGIDGKIAPHGYADAISTDGLAMTISVKGGVPTIDAMSAVKRLALGLPIDLNRASFEELMLVPGIGETVAGRIVQTRQLQGQFEAVSDLAAIPGLKGKKIEGLKRYLMVTTVH
jgi:hypothetical protein